jgi:hypothetical protein
MDTTTHVDCYGDSDSLGLVAKFTLKTPVTNDVAQEAIDTDLEDELGALAQIGDRVHDSHPLDAAHPFQVRRETMDIPEVTSLAQAMQVAQDRLAELAKRRRSSTSGSSATRRCRRATSSASTTRSSGSPSTGGSTPSRRTCRPTSRTSASPRSSRRTSRSTTARRSATRASTTARSTRTGRRTPPTRAPTTRRGSGSRTRGPAAPRSGRTTRRRLGRCGSRATSTAP